MSESDCCGSRIRNPSGISGDGVCMDCKEHCGETYDEAQDNFIDSIHDNIYEMICGFNRRSTRKKILSLNKL